MSSTFGQPPKRIKKT